MNAITRALLEHELEDIQECHARTINQVEHLREQLRKAEEARDEYVEQIGALKEDLGRREVTTTLHVHTDGIQKAMKTFQERLDKLYA